MMSPSLWEAGSIQITNEENESGRGGTRVSFLATAIKTHAQIKTTQTNVRLRSGPLEAAAIREIPPWLC